MLEERELLIKLREGDHGAFEQLYHLHKLRLAGNLVRILKSWELAEEVLQDLFLKIWEHRERIDPDQPFKAYLFRIADNLVRDIFRRASRDKKLHEHFRIAVSEAYSHIEETIFRRENRDQLYAALALLPEQRRKVFILCKLEEKSYKEAGELLHITAGTVGDHLKKANKFLKEHFTAQSGITALVIVHAIFNGFC